MTPNTPDVREAAERLRRARQGSDDHDGGYPATDTGRFQSLCDHATLADAYLCEHPADESEPVTEAWLLSIGFHRHAAHFMRSLDGEFFLHAYECSPWTIDTKDTSRQYYGCSHSLDVSHPKTRNDVRRLLAALSIPLPPEAR